MHWLKTALFVVVLTSGLVSECYARNNTYFEVVQRYERCVLNRLPRSHVFTEEDRVRMVKIANEANHRMHLLHMDPTNAPNARSMLRLFAAALANLVADSDVPKTPERKDTYITVIEACSSALPRPVAEKLVQDVKRTFTSVENTRLGGNEAPVLSRRRGMSSESSESLDDDAPIQRTKRSPQAVAFSSFGGWQPTESLQTVLSNILLNSNVFMNVFKDGITRVDAIYYARSMVDAGLVDYHFSVVQDVLNSVSNALSTFPFRPQTADFAYAISSSIASVFDARQLSFFADGVGIGNKLVSKLQMMVASNNPTVSFPISSDGAASSFSWRTSSGSQQRTVSRPQVNSGFMQSQQSSRGFASSQNPAQNQKGFGSQQEPPFFEEFTFPETQPSAPNPEFFFPETQPSALYPEFIFPETEPFALDPEFQYEPPQYPDSGMLPLILPEKTDNYPQTQEFSYDASDSEPVPAQQPTISKEYPQYDRGSDSAVPADYMGDDFRTSDTDTSRGQKASSDSRTSDTDTSSGQKASSDSRTSDTDTSSGQKASSNSRTEESGDKRFESSESSSSVNNKQISSDSFDSTQSRETGPEKSSETFENSQSKGNAESRNSEMSTTLSPLDRTVFIANTDTQTSSTVNIITTTTPYPYTTTTLDAGKVAEILLDDIFESLRTLNSSSGDSVKPQKGSSDVVNKDSSAKSGSGTISNIPLKEENEPDESKPTTITDKESNPKQQTPVTLEPSFWTTSSPGTSEASSVTGFKNETQSSDVAPDEGLELRDPTLVFAEHVAAIATSTIILIRSEDGISLQNLCDKVNELAPVVDIPPLDVCNTTALVDYLLNVLKTVTYILRSV